MEERLLDLLYEEKYVEAGRLELEGVRVGMLCSCESLYRETGFLERPGFASTYTRCCELPESSAITQLCDIRSQLVLCYQTLSLAASSSEAFSYSIIPPTSHTSSTSLMLFLSFLTTNQAS